MEEHIEIEKNESMKRIYDELALRVQPTRIFVEEPMWRHISFKVGGPAKFLVTPKTVEELVGIVELCVESEWPYLILGNGSNVIFDDEGYSGIVIKISTFLSKIQVIGNQIKVQSGALMAAVSSKAMEHSLTGFEFASGIPGTLGGAVFMNAGAYGGEMKDIVDSVTVLCEDGKLKKRKAEDLDFAYRHSIFQSNDEIIVEVTLNLTKGNKKAILEEIKTLAHKRNSKQPVTYPSAGSIFKRPEGHYAGQLIDEAGLRGVSIGGAQVSELHCGFIINTGNATAKDIMRLISKVQNDVYVKSGVMLEPEVRFVIG